MAIEDLSGNEQLETLTASFLGFSEAVVDEENALNLDIYSFIIEPVRTEDAVNGRLFLRRFLEGPQSVWNATHLSVLALRDIWSLTRCPAHVLPYVKHLFGWTGELDAITDRLDEAALRRLIDASIPLWKSRGPEDSIENVLFLLTAARSRVWTWFDVRYLIGEASVGEARQGRDAYLIEAPGDDDDEYRMHVRIVDDGDLDRDLVIEVLKLMRPLGERFDVLYLSFLDVFETDGDNTQWTSGAVAGGDLALADDTADEEAVVNVDGAGTWADYCSFVRAKGPAGGGYGVRFYRTDDENFYGVELDVDANTLRLFKTVVAAETTIATVDLSTNGVTLLPDVYYGLRVAIAASGATNSIKVYLDGDELIDTTDSAHSEGAVSVWHEVGTTVAVSEVEVFALPVDTDEVDINTR